ncbi:hypothetical protein DFH09DRAFT_951237 [Mycena vulgaris]|nr:hypothetical protein DFH09DRAFT_951237 [Mycena vulgaris]
MPQPSRPTQTWAAQSPISTAQQQLAAWVPPYYYREQNQPQFRPARHAVFPGDQSAEVPIIKPVIVGDWTQIRFDLREQAHDGMTPTAYMLNRHHIATASAATHVRLISRVFPWSIEILSNKPVTCEDVGIALYAALQQPISDSEWGAIVDAKELRDKIEGAARRRAESDGDARLKRIDWLGSDTVFSGLEKMEDFQEERLLPGADPCAETWVVKLVSSSAVEEAASDSSQSSLGLDQITAQNTVANASYSGGEVIPPSPAHSYRPMR